MTSKANFVQQQGFPETDAPTCGLRYPALMFQPRVLGVLVIVGLFTQSPLLFLALGILLVWNVAFPKWNAFDAVYALLIARPRRLPRPDPAPAPRRFAQGMAATLMLAVAFSLLAGVLVLAWILEALLVAALAALIFGRFCLGSYLYSVFSSR